MVKLRAGIDTLNTYWMTPESAQELCANGSGRHRSYFKPYHRVMQRKPK